MSHYYYIIVSIRLCAIIWSYYLATVRILHCPLPSLLRDLIIANFYAIKQALLICMQPKTAWWLNNAQHLLLLQDYKHSHYKINHWLLNTRVQNNIAHNQHTYISNNATDKWCALTCLWSRNSKGFRTLYKLMFTACLHAISKYFNFERVH